MNLNQTRPMKKAISMMAIAAFLFSMPANAQETPKKKEKSKTEKSCSKDEMKSCSKEKKAGCCAKK